MIYLKIQKLLSKKGQSALEYLLIIGGVLVIAVVVITLIMTTGRSNTEKLNESEQQHSQLIDSTIIPPMILNVNCFESTNKIIITYNKSSTTGIENYCLVFNDTIKNSLCLPPVDGVSELTFTDAVKNHYDLVSGERYKISLVAKRGEYTSQPALPSPTCVVN